ncbi:unnamed protein product [Schistosoma turkestanicum]|nr:unnamed protein product [Schistosoma turkestanicum]
MNLNHQSNQRLLRKKLDLGYLEGCRQTPALDINGLLYKVCVAAASLPTIALIMCVVWCLATDSCVTTHCTDTNFLPSLSAAVGTDQPQRAIWIISILISSAWRLLILLNSYINSWKLFSVFSNGRQFYLPNLLYLSSFIEIISLNMLSIVSSTDNYIQHRNYFCTFVLFSVVYMMTDVYVSQHKIKLTQDTFLVRKPLPNAYGQFDQIPNNE